VVSGLPPEERGSAAVGAIRWMIEEFRVNQFAQMLGTPAPVSAKRIRTALQALNA
jgi:ATP-dependent helicase HrpA